MAVHGLRLVDKHTQQWRHKVQRGHAKLLHQLRNALRVAVFARPGQYQRATGHQRPKTFPHRHVKTDRRFLQQHVIGLQSVGGLHPVQTLTQRGMGIAHAFGQAGGAGGVNHIRQVIAVQVQARRMAGPGVELEQVHRNHAHALHRRQGLQ